MSLRTNIENAMVRIGTEFKTIRTLISGTATGGLTGLQTTDKTSLVSAINEVRATAGASNLDALSDVTLGTRNNNEVLMYDSATSQWVNKSGTSVFQPLSANLTSLAGQASTAYGRGLLNLADSAALTGQVRTATTAVTGITRLATAPETATGTAADVAVTPAGVKPLLDAKANTASLGYFATGTDAANLTGTLPSAVLPPLAVNEVFVVASQAAMLALTAQRGDMAVRTDNGKTYVLSADAPATLANWVEITASGVVTSVAGRTGAVTLTKSDVGLANVDNTSDANKPISTATQTALNAKEPTIAAGTTAQYWRGDKTWATHDKASVGLGNVDNTSDAAKPISTATQTALNGKQPIDADLTAIAALASAADRLPYATGANTWALATFTATGRAVVAAADAAALRGVVDTYSTAQIGDPETDFAAVFVSALA